MGRKTNNVMTLLKTILVMVVVVGTPIKSDDAIYSTEVSVVENGRDVTVVTPKPKNYEETTTVRVRGSVKYSGADAKWAERPVKPFLYGRKFELPKDTAKQSVGDALYSPIITSPIRTFPANPDSETLKQNQNEIFSSIRDFLSETTEGNFNKTYFLEDAKESENHGGEASTTEKPQESSEGNSSASRSRQDGDRSLLVVLPFKANGENIEELFTKSPMVKVIETSDDLEKTGITQEGTTNSPPIVREIVPATDKPDFTTRKRWRPTKRYRTTTESYETTTENGEDVTKTYTNYNDVEMVTKRYQFQFTENLTNHKYEEELTTPNPIIKRFRNKIKAQEEKTTTENLSIVDGNQEKETKGKLKRKGLRRKTTTSTEGPPKPEDLSKVLDILPPDMKDLILQIGLNKENKEEQASEDNFRFERVPHPSIDPQSYAVFKPLPIEEKDENRQFVPDDMKEFLASFGLLPTGKRVQKSLKTPPPKEADKKPIEDVSEVNFDFLPDDLKSVLEDMGLVRYSNKKEPTRIHIFNPSNHSIAHSEEDFEKLNAILSSIKTTVNESQSLTPEMQSEIIEKIRDLDNLRYKNGNLSEINNEIKKINNKTNPAELKPRTTAKRATKLFEGPDPLLFSEESILKNDVKRQDSANSSSSSSSASNSATSSSSASSSADDTSSSASSSASASADSETVTEEAPNIEALKESFGGGETASDDADIESSLPPKRPNGLYLLLDWNSFLEVGTDDDSRRVNLRFQPKIGDSRNFLPVTVP